MTGDDGGDGRPDDSQAWSLSSLRGRRVRERDGRLAGVVTDVYVARDDPGSFPVVQGVLVDRDGRQRSVPPTALTGQAAPSGVTVTASPAPGTALGADRQCLWAELAGRWLVDVTVPRVGVVRDVCLGMRHGELCLIGVTTGRGRSGRLFRRRRFVGWPAVEVLGVRRDQNSNSALSRLRPGQVAALLEDLDDSNRQELLDTLDLPASADALEEMDQAELERLLRCLTLERAARLLAAMEPDEAAEAIRRLDRRTQDELLGRMPPGAAHTLEGVLNYPEAMAGGFMNPKIFCAWPQETVAGVRSRLLALDGDWSDLDAIVLLDENSRMTADLPIAALFLAAPGTSVERLAGAQAAVTVADTALVSDVARALIESRRSSVVVTGEDARPVGRVLADDLIDALLPGRALRRPRFLP